MLWFLRLFPQFRAFERDAEEWSETEAALRHELRLHADEIAFWRDRVNVKDAEIARLNALLIDEAHKVADTMSVHAIGKRVFSKAPAEPPAEVRQQQPQVGRQLARVAQHQQMQKTRDDLKKLWDNLPPAEAN